MTVGNQWTGLVVLGMSLLASVSSAAEPDAARRGEKALLEQAFTPPMWSRNAYQTVWRRWENADKTAPADFADAFRVRYGLHSAPYPNGVYPMGLREAQGRVSKGVATDCLLCHGGSILGQSYVGLGNASLDIQALFDELTVADGMPARLPHTFCNVRGTSEAGAMAVYLFGLREPDLRLRKWQNLGLHDDLCEDVPAWWLLKKKQTMYYTGGGDARSVRSLMQFMLTPLNSRAALEKHEPVFADLREYLLTLQPPKYPFAINHGLAEKGEAVFRSTCSICHGTYGAKPTYPNKIVPLDVIGTDRRRYEGITAQLGEHYNRSWFAQEQKGWLSDGYPARATAGYQAPPLDGVWATAPYFHNGAAPTVYDVLNSKTRPARFTRSYRTGAEEYDPVQLGWKVRVLDRPTNPTLPALERRKVYDTSLPGRSNAGHTFGDELTDDERMAVIEYLKTL